MPHFNTLKSIKVTLYARKGSKKNVQAMPQETFTCSKVTIEMLEKIVEYDQS